MSHRSIAWKNACSLSLSPFCFPPAPRHALFSWLLFFHIDSPVEPSDATRRRVPRERRRGLGARPGDVDAGEAPDRLRKEVGAGAGAEDEGDVGEGGRRGHRSLRTRGCVRVRACVWGSSSEARGRRALLPPPPPRCPRREKFERVVRELRGGRVFFCPRQKFFFPRFSKVLFFLVVEKARLPEPSRAALLRPSRSLLWPGSRRH